LQQARRSARHAATGNRYCRYAGSGNAYATGNDAAACSTGDTGSGCRQQQCHHTTGARGN